jgi:hypothetical protein
MGNIQHFSALLPGFLSEKQENLRMLRVQAYLSVIRAWFWPESRDALEGVDSG